MRPYTTLFLLVSLQLHLTSGNCYGESSFDTGTSGNSPLWKLDFSLLAEPARKALLDLGFTFEKQMRDENKILITLDNGNLTFTATDQAFGYMVKKELYITDAKWLKIEWGAEAYPPSGDWQNDMRYEPLMIIFFFGEPIPNDSFFLPDMPSFVGMFLGKKEIPLQQYASPNYPETGRYVCLGNPDPGQAIVSEINLAQHFSALFAGQDMPPITGIAIEVDTGELPYGATSSAFVKNISLR
jgi:hypothetical protein